MTEHAWEVTVANKTETKPNPEGGLGCLLQIHPLDISAELVALDQSRMFVGRETENEICIQCNSVSRQHALIQRSDNGYTIEDLDSTNGVCVNEKRTESAKLEPGDRIQLGNFIFKFLEYDHIELQYHEAVYSMMTRDGLTGTLNKRSFLDIIGREFRRSVHRQTSLSLILFDIDHFKSVNDTHGHLAGDEVLQGVADRIGTVVAEHDVFARYGGEEFAILLPDVEKAEAADVAERCRAAIESQDFATSIGPLPIRISVGVAEVAELSLNPTDDSENSSLLVDATDKRLYQAKETGRNRVCS